MKILKNFFKILNFDQRKSLVYLTFLMFIAMLAETLGLGLIIPAISLITSSDIIEKYPFIISYVNFINDVLRLEVFFTDLSEKNQIFLTSLILLTLIYVFKNILLGYISWKIAAFSCNFYYYWSSKLFSIYLNQPYSFHLKNNTAILIRNMTTVAELGNFMRSLVILILESLTFIGIIVFLIYFNPKLTALALSVFLLLFFLSLKTSNKFLKKMGEDAHYYNAKIFQHLQQGLGGIKELKILGKENYFSSVFDKSVSKLTIINRNLEFINALPKFFIESIVILTLITPMIVGIFYYESLSIFTSTIAVYAVSFFRIMPSLNKMILRFQDFKFVAPKINNLYVQFSLTKNNQINSKGRIKFQNLIQLEDVSFKYENKNKYILKNVNIKINKNEIVGIIGATGSGKSTLVNLLNGLLEPTSGKVRVDGLNIQENIHGWKKNIGYVPQNIFLVDDTILKNIAFGVEENQINKSLAIKSLTEAQFKESVSIFPEGIMTFVGERGSRLSGGEIQRVGISRALYNNSELLVFDEFTSNLDAETEDRIFKTILSFKGKKTIIIISHNPKIKSLCDSVYKVEKGCATKI